MSQHVDLSIKSELNQSFLLICIRVQERLSSVQARSILTRPKSYDRTFTVLRHQFAATLYQSPTALARLSNYCQLGNTKQTSVTSLCTDLFGYRSRISGAAFEAGKQHSNWANKPPKENSAESESHIETERERKQKLKTICQPLCSEQRYCQKDRASGLRSRLTSTMAA